MTETHLQALYVIVGMLVVTNLGTVGAVIVFIFKAGKFVANTENGIQNAQATGNRAHKRLTDHEQLFHKGGKVI